MVYFIVQQEKQKENPLFLVRLRQTKTPTHIEFDFFGGPAKFVLKFHLSKLSRMFLSAIGLEDIVSRYSWEYLIDVQGATEKVFTHWVSLDSR